LNTSPGLDISGRGFSLAVSR